MNDIRDKQLIATFQRSLILSVCCASLVLSSAEGRLWPSAFTVVVAIVSWIAVEVRAWLKMPIWGTNVLGVLALLAFGYEFATGNIEAKLLSGAHLIVYLTWIVLLMTKSRRQYWGLMALCILQLAVSAVLTNTPGFGISLMGMLFALLWTLSVFSLFVTLQEIRDLTSERAPGLSPAGPAIITEDGLQRDFAEPWVDSRFRGIVGLSYLTSLVLAFVVFAAFPRTPEWGAGTVFAGSAAQGQERTGIVHRTGFTDTVKLGEIGSLLQSSDRVLQFQISEVATGRKATVDEFITAMRMDEILFRGNAMGFYRDGEWSRGLSERGYRAGEVVHDMFGENIPDDPFYKLEIQQDPPIGQFAFAVFPFKKAVAKDGSGKVVVRTVTGSLVWASSRNIPQDAQRSFEIFCPRIDRSPDLTFDDWMLKRTISQSAREEGVRRLDEFASHMFITEGLEESLPNLTQLARSLCYQNGQRLSAEKCVQKIVAHLSISDRYRYSTVLTRQDSSIDPIEDFLLNTNSGHCEYFASACALMLQSVGVPARLINGFAGCEMNTVTQQYEVTQKQAHTWVEAFVNGRWQTVDPTPAAPRADEIRRIGSQGLVTDLQLAFSDFWKGGVNNLTLEKQKAFFDPVIEFSQTTWNGIRENGLWPTISNYFYDLMSSPEKWVSWQGGALTFLLLLMAAGLWSFHPLDRLMQIYRKLSNWFSSRSRTERSVIRFYSRFCQLCERHGLKCSPHQTALEIASRAGDVFSEKLNSTGLAELPLQIAQAFNQVRFGSIILTDEQTLEIGRELERFAEALSANSQTSKTAESRS
ncbi:MAG: DUF3488 domain-containing protein [Planctomyces sp.]|nr:DUF3488 domain-containing protein [Planctomyces sp.]